jgi:protein gp37
MADIYGERHIDLHRWLIGIAAVALAVATAVPTSTMAQRFERTKVGMLNCDMSAGIGVIIASKKRVTCMFTPALRGPREVYVGNISKFGHDVVATSGGEMVWAVYAATSRRSGALAGHYVGATAEATIGAGLGANVLVGGSNRTVALQPQTVPGQARLNVAAGVAELTLRPAR